MAVYEDKTLPTYISLYRNIDRPCYNQPTEIGVLSLDENGQFRDDGSSLKYYHPGACDDVRRKKFDLNVGYEEFLKTERKPEAYQLNIDNLLKWISAHKDEIAEEGSTRLRADFVCWRGSLTKLLTTVYEQRDDWIIGVSLYSGTYYLREYGTYDRLYPDPRQQQLTYWGQKFEHFCVTDRPGGLVEDPNRVKLTKKEFRSVVSTKLKEHRLLLAAEVDCCDPADKKRYIELKTNRIFSNPRQEQNFGRYKALRLWAQSFLIGIDKIVVGFRDDDGHVQDLRTYQTKELPNLALGEWDPATALTFTHSVLNFIKKTVQTDDPKAVCLLRYRAAESRITAELHAGPSEWTFLPDWYINSTT